uniref:NAD-dependent protein deacylase n=1 Tax=Steinernema glaseri TaxID=37863 RepID=A0A1I7Z6Q7_9BILA
MSPLGRFVPKFAPVPKKDVARFLDELAGINKLLVLTGAGLSTESGIPDYRSAEVGQYARTNHRPITHQEFFASEDKRRRYWSRNYVAWPRFSSAPCNDAHYSLASWERSDRFLWLITQNVDGLHTQAGSEMVTELHGCGRQVVCHSCYNKYSRHDVQEWIKKANPDWTIREIGELAPDGDVEIPDSALETFKVPHCPTCGPGSILKTDVVFFGDNVRRDVVDFCYQKVDESDGLLVLGSSLTVMSGYRFVYQASLRRIPILIVNIGPTRGDHLATVKLSAKCSDIVKMI